MHKRSKYQGFFKINEIFGDWIIIGPDITMDNRGRAFIRCKCAKCQTETDKVSCHHLVRGRTRKCDICANSYDLRGYDKNPHWQGEGVVPKTILTKISSSASHKGIPYNLTLNYVNTLYNNSSKTCAISGEPLNFTGSVSHWSKTFTGGMCGGTEFNVSNATLVPIIPTLGYVENNVTWVDTKVAAMKAKCVSDDEFINMCLKVAAQHQFKNPQQIGVSNESEKSKKDPQND